MHHFGSILVGFPLGNKVLFFPCPCPYTMPGLLPISESAAEGILSDYDSAITSDSEGACRADNDCA